MFPGFLLEYSVRDQVVIVVEQDVEAVEVVEDEDCDGEGFGVVFVAGCDVDAVEEVLLKFGIIDEDPVDLIGSRGDVAPVGEILVLVELAGLVVGEVETQGDDHEG